jgi:replicative DNA helicase
MGVIMKNLNLVTSNKEFLIPYSEIIEYSVLELILFHEKHQDLFFSLIDNENYFNFATTQKVYNLIKQMKEDNKPICFNTVITNLYLIGENEIASRLLDTSANGLVLDYQFQDYLRQMQELYIRRSIVVNALENLDKAADIGKDLKEIIDHTQNKMVELSLVSDPENKTQKDILLELMDFAENTLKPDFDLTNVSTTTGFKALDGLIVGWQDSKYYIIAARPGMGKTSFVLNSAMEIVKKGKPVLFISMEMKTKDLLTKIACSELGISAFEFKTGMWNRKVSKMSLDLKLTEIIDLPLYITDDIYDISKVRTKAKEIKKATEQMPVIIIDYLQLMDSPGNGRPENRTQEITKISMGLKRLNNELNTPIIALSQLSRNLEQRQDKRPMMSDLRESGQIEQDSDLIAFLYREAYYNPNSENKDTEFIIAKNREGARDTILLNFDLTSTRFSDKEVTNDH